MEISNGETLSIRGEIPYVEKPPTQAEMRGLTEAFLNQLQPLLAIKKKLDNLTNVLETLLAERSNERLWGQLACRRIDNLLEQIRPGLKPKRTMPKRRTRKKVKCSPKKTGKT